MPSPTEKPWPVAKVAIIGVVIGALYGVANVYLSSAAAATEMVGSIVGGAIGGAIVGILTGLIRNWWVGKAR